jgi:hypothetical protein
VRRGSKGGPSNVQSPHALFAEVSILTHAALVPAQFFRSKLGWTLVQLGWHGPESSAPTLYTAIHFISAIYMLRH